MTPTWRNREFSALISHTNNNFDNCPWTRVPLWKPWGQQRSTISSLEQKLWIGALNKEQLQVHSSHTFPTAAYISAKKEPPMISPTGETENRMCTHLPSSMGCCSGVSSFSLHQNTESIRKAGKKKRMHNNQGTEFNKGRMILLTTPRFQQEAYPQSSEDTLSDDNPN